MRPAAEIGELALGVDADGGRVAALGLGRRRQVLDELDLEGLVRRAEQLESFRARQLLAGNRQVLGDDLGHLLLDAREVGLADRLGKEEVVVEAVLDGRPDGVLGAREQAQNGLRHDVRRGVADDVEPLRRVGRDDCEGVAVGEQAVTCRRACR